MGEQRRHSKEYKIGTKKAAEELEMLRKKNKELEKMNKRLQEETEPLPPKGGSGSVDSYKIFLIKNTQIFSKK